MVTGERETLSGPVDDGHICGPGGPGTWLTHGKCLGTTGSIADVWLHNIFNPYNPLPDCVQKVGLY